MTDSRGRRPFRLSLGAKHVTRDVDQEIEFHIAMRAQALVATGLDPETARAQAIAQFGNSAAVRAECLVIDTQRTRAMTATERLDNLRRDAAYAVRSLRQHPGFAIVVILILALGIGANTATFSVIDALMLRPLPVEAPEQLVTVGDPKAIGRLSEGTPNTAVVSYPLYLDIRDGNHVLSGLYATGRSGRLDAIIDHRPDSGRGTPAEAEHPRGRFVSTNFFSVLGVHAYAGRTFAPTEGLVAGADPVVVISHAYWRKRFASDPRAVGRSIIINGAPLVIVGVAAEGFSGDLVGQDIDVWMPITMEPTVVANEQWLTHRDVSWLLLMGRLAPGVSLTQARAALTVLETRSVLDHATAGDRGYLEQNLRESPPQVGPGARGFSYYRASLASALVTLTAAVALVLIVVCANVANLMLARAAARGREISVRIALGAGRGRLIQQLLTESAILAAVGAAAGLLVAWWGSATLLRVAARGPGRIPLDVRFDGPVLVFTVALSIATMLLIGLVPALRATRADVAAALRTQGRDSGAERAKPGRLPLGKGLVVAQVALSMLLLVGTGMLVRSTERLEHADVGVARDRLVIAAVAAQQSGYSGPRLTALIRDLLARTAAVPGVAAISLSENGLFNGTESATNIQVEGFTARVDSDTAVAYDDVGPGYFNAVGGHLLRGRDIGTRDDESAPKVAVINETMSRFFFPHGDALGRHFKADSATWEIVGIVADANTNDVRESPIRRFYIPMVQQARPPGQFKLEVRTGGDPARLLVPVRHALTAADPALIVTDIEPLAELIRDSIAQDRLVAQAVSFFGAIALVLSALGLYGVMAYATARRTTEFGLRMALGAEPGAVIRMVLGEAMRLAAAGIVLGLPVAIAASQLIRGRLFHIGIFDPPSIGIAVVVLAVSAAIAALLPALRASSVAPLAAIRAS
jgi:predicted permease